MKPYSCLKCNHRASVRVSLQCLWSDDVPSHFIHKSDPGKQVTTLSIHCSAVRCQLTHREQADYLGVAMSSRCCWGHCNVQGKFFESHSGTLQTATTCSQSNKKGSLSNCQSDVDSGETLTQSCGAAANVPHPGLMTSAGPATDV